MAKWLSRPRTRGFQIRKPQTADKHAAATLAMATTSAGFSAQPLVPPAGRHAWSDPQGDDHRLSPKAPRCLLEIRYRRRRHRRSDDENRMTCAPKTIPSTGI